MDDREVAAKELGVNPDWLERYSFPQAFGSTTGPFGGIGGQMVTTCQIDAYTDGVKTVFFCGGRRVKCIDGWNPRISMPR